MLLNNGERARQKGIGIERVKEGEGGKGDTKRERRVGKVCLCEGVCWFSFWAFHFLTSCQIN